MSDQQLAEAVSRMTRAHVAPEAIETFTRAFAKIAAGETGIIAESSIAPVADLPSLADLGDPAGGTVNSMAEADGEALAHTVMIRLNGGLGTSMGIEGAKSLLPVKAGRTFLDIIANQVLALRREHGVALPLIFMNSFRTQQLSARAIAQFPDLAVHGLPTDFLQSQEPKLRASDLGPIDWPADPQLEWCPPGHADIFPSLRASGLLDRLIAAGYRYAFCANADNLGATVDARIPAWMSAHDVPFVLECCLRTPAERKGGHLATRRSDGRLVLRESAQTSPDDVSAMQDLDRHRYFNTNNLWIDLAALAAELDRSGGSLDLPIIRNLKTVDPGDADSPQVIQIESAMGSAITLFAGARAIVVERDRFIPIKTTDDLLVLRSDVYALDDSYRVRQQASGPAPLVSLDSAHFKLLADFDRRFPDGAPSLIDATSLTVHGDVTFGADVRITGDVVVRADVPSGSVLDG